MTVTMIPVDLIFFLKLLFHRALCVVWTTPLVATLGMSLTIPLAMVADMLIHGRHYSAVYILGSAQVMFFHVYMYDLLQRSILLVMLHGMPKCIFESLDCTTSEGFRELEIFQFFYPFSDITLIIPTDFLESKKSMS